MRAERQYFEGFLGEEQGGRIHVDNNSLRGFFFSFSFSFFLFFWLNRVAENAAESTDSANSK